MKESWAGVLVVPAAVEFNRPPIHVVDIPPVDNTFWEDGIYWDDWEGYWALVFAQRDDGDELYYKRGVRITLETADEYAVPPPPPPLVWDPGDDELYYKRSVRILLEDADELFYKRLVRITLETDDELYRDAAGHFWEPPTPPDIVGDEFWEAGIFYSDVEGYWHHVTFMLDEDEQYYLQPMPTRDETDDEQYLRIVRIMLDEDDISAAQPASMRTRVMLDEDDILPEPTTFYESTDRSYDIIVTFSR